MTDPLFAVLPGPAGPMRKALDAKIAELTGQQVDLPADLVILQRSLADRIDGLNAQQKDRGFVMVSQEYRAARRDLYDGLAVSADDGLEAALADFRAAAAGHPTAAGPAD